MNASPAKPAPAAREGREARVGVVLAAAADWTGTVAVLGSAVVLRSADPVTFNAHVGSAVSRPAAWAAGLAAAGLLAAGVSRRPAFMGLAAGLLVAATLWLVGDLYRTRTVLLDTPQGRLAVHGRTGDAVVVGHAAAVDDAWRVRHVARPADGPARPIPLDGRILEDVRDAPPRHDAFGVVWMLAAAAALRASGVAALAVWAARRQPRRRAAGVACGWAGLVTLTLLAAARLP